MKQLIIILFLFISSLPFASAQAKKAVTPANVTVYYFHGVRRCPGCIAAEKVTIESLNSLYAKEQKSGQVKYIAINLEEDKNKALVEKYQIGWSTLLFVKTKNGKEDTKNLTDDAFSYGRSNPEKLKGLIKTTIDNMLK